MSAGQPASRGSRSLAEAMRAWSDDDLTALLKARSDLVSPAPHDSAQLAARASTRSSAVRALDDLTHFELALVGAVATAQPADRQVLAAKGQAIDEAMARLESRALIWQADDGLRLVGGVAEALGPRGFPTATTPVPPAVPASPRDPALIQRSAAGAVADVVRRATVLLELWSQTPAPTLRGGGLGVRELRSIAARLHVDTSEAAFIADLVVEAGLATTAATGVGDVAYQPTDAFDRWTQADLAARWLVLARAWLASDRTPSLVGRRDPQGKAINLLVPELVSTTVARNRQLALKALASIDEDQTLAAGTGLPGVIAFADWVRPRAGGPREADIESSLNESAILGVTGLGGLTPWGRLLIAGQTTEAEGRLAAALPPPIEHVVIQADMTAVAPGPLAPGLARDIELLADIESSGGATVYRFSAASLRRGLDAGWSAADIHTFLDQASSTPVPQALTYLVDDSARTHGTVRAGHAEAFLRSDDEGALTALLHHPDAMKLGLRRIAPTVVVSSIGLDLLLPRLRACGVSPAVEAPDGTIHVARPDHHRARIPKASARGVAQAREAARIPAVIAAIRAGDAAGVGRRRTGPMSPADALAALREAIDAHTDVVVSYLDNHGASTERLVTPQRITDGILLALDRRTEEDRSFAIHRIRDVRSPSSRPVGPGNTLPS